MSSHHVVREGQEPALYIYEFQAEDLSLVEALLEWSPTLFVHESQLRNAILQQFHWDIIVGNKAIDLLHTKSIADDELARALKETSNTAITILMQSIADMKLFHKIAEQFDLKIIAEARQWYHISEYQKWFPAHTSLYFMNIHANDIKEEFRLIDTNIYEYTIPEDGQYRFKLTKSTWIGEKF